MWGIVGTYVVLSRRFPHFTAFGHQIDLPGFRMAVAQVAAGQRRRGGHGGDLLRLLPDAPGLTFWKFLGIYIAAYTAGLAASVPGGLGVFDGFILLSLEPYLPSAQVVGALLLFRLFYYIVPLFLAGGLFAAFELGSADPHGAAADGGARDGALEVPVLAGLTGLGGVVLLFVGALPARGSDIAHWGGEWAALASQFAASVVGSLLLVVSYGMLRRLRLAWWAGLFLLANGVAILAIRGDPWWVAAAYLGTGLFLAAMGGAFYRDARLTGEPLTASRVFSLAAGVICGLTLATVAYHGRVSEAAWWEVVLLSGMPAPLRFGVGVSALLLIFAAFRLLRPARIHAEDYDEVRAGAACGVGRAGAAPRRWGGLRRWRAGGLRLPTAGGDLGGRGRPRGGAGRPDQRDLALPGPLRRCRGRPGLRGGGAGDAAGLRGRRHGLRDAAGRAVHCAVGRPGPAEGAAAAGGGRGRGLGVVDSWGFRT